MIAKLCAWGPDRGAAVVGMARALEAMHLEGLGHNTAFLSAVMDQERFRSGALSTRYIADEFPDGFHGLEPTPWQLDAMAAACAWMHRTLTARARTANGGLQPAARARWVIACGHAKRFVDLEDVDGGLEVGFADEDRAVRLSDVDWRPGQALFHGALDGRAFTATVAPAAEGFTIRHRAASARVLPRAWCSRPCLASSSPPTSRPATRWRRARSSSSSRR
jgi:propionyl-CoA carboxylase alpha chain